MKKMYIFLTMLFLLLCTGCSGKNNNVSDYVQNDMQYGTLIDRTRMSISLNDQRLGNRNYVIQPDGSLWTWGTAVDLYNFSGYLESNITPSAMKLMDDVVNYSADMYNLLAVKKDGGLWSWELDWPDANIGYPSYGGPTHIMDNVVDVSNKSGCIMAIDSDGGLWSWGRNGYGQLGDGTTEDRYEPTKIMDDVVSVCISGSYAMAIKSNGSLWGWGYNGYGQLGDGTNKDQYKPIKIMNDVVAASCAGGISMALCEDGSLWGWGGYASFKTTLDEIAGTQTKETKENKYYKPVKVFDDVIGFSIAGDPSLCVIMAIKSDGSLWGWGNNVYGQLANSDKGVSVEPIHIMDDIVYVSVFEDQYIMAVGNDDSVWLWGKGADLESNINDRILSTPVRVDLDNLPDNSTESDWMIEDNNSDSEIFGVEEIDGETISYDTTAGFSKPLEYYFELSGSYKSNSGQSTLSISIYSSADGETGIGTVWIDTEEESYYLGEIIAELEENVYLAETDMGEETVLYVYYIYSEEAIYIDLDVDGQYIGGYTMVEHYVS